LLESANLRCNFDESATPKLIRLHFVRVEVIAACKVRATLSGAQLANALARIGYGVTRLAGG
jgi:hypothetical protein